MDQPKYILDTRYDSWMIVSVYIVVIILIIILYFFSYFANNVEDDLEISKAQFDVLARKVKIPEGPGVGASTTNDGYVNPENLTIADLDLLVGYEECPENECAIDLATGVKRCPENPNTRIVYNRGYESCTQKFFCTSEELPYAVLTSGETDNFGVCETGVACRCTDIVVCPKYVTSAINIRNGNNYSSSGSGRDYYFDQTTAPLGSVTGYDSITIPKSMVGKRFCSINPSYMDRMNGGCNFANTNSDILGCLTSNDFYKISESEFFDEYGSNFELGYQNNPDNDYNTYKYQSSLNLVGTFKPKSGFAVTTNEDGSSEIVSYDRFTGNIETIGDQESSIAQDIYSITISDDTITQDLGVQSDLSNRGNGTLAEFFDIIYTGCPNSSSKTNVSNRNMLLCVQNTEQPCLEGQLTYIPKEKRACDFCQDTRNTLQYVEDVKNISENDPENILVSCTVGAGCGGNYNTSFCEDGDCTSVISKLKRNYLGEYDSDGVKNVWTITKSAVKISGKITYTVGIGGNLNLENDGLMELQSGDYFSYSRLTLSKIVSEEVQIPDAGNFIIKLGTTEDLLPQFNIYYENFKGNIVSIDSEKNEITVVKTDGDATVIPEYAIVRFLSVVTDSSYQYGKFWVDDEKNVFPSGIVNPRKLEQWSTLGPDTVYVYKQFGFNGINYNTYTDIVKVNKKYTIFRKYSSTSNWGYWISDENNLLPPLSSSVIPVLQKYAASKRDLDSIVFSSPNADFKKDLSFYYPVWDVEKNKQICVKCKPNLVTYTKIKPINEKENLNSRLASVVIQYSGRDFGQYVYYPTLTRVYKPENNWNTGRERYCYSVFSTISGIESSTRRIVLNEINPNIPFTADLPENYYSENSYYLADSYNALRKRFRYDTGEKSQGPPENINPKILRDVLEDNYYETNILEDRYNFYRFQGEYLKPDDAEFVISPNRDSYINNRPNLKNYFLGKTYFDVESDIRLYLESDVRITRVELIEGQQVIFTNAVQGEDFPGETLEGLDIVLQVLSENDNLGFKLEKSISSDSELIFSEIEVYPKSISDGRVTEIGFSDDTDEFFDIGNVPRLLVTKYRNID